MERLSSGGIPVYWEAGPEPAAGGLLFRAGIADEPAACRGQSHLVEHLTLHRVGRREFSSNGFVDSLSTVFYASGTTDEVAGFLHDVTVALHQPIGDRFATELEVLRTESAQDVGDFVSRTLYLRFGNRSFGLGMLQELGLRWMGPPDVERWRAERYTAGNAVAWVHSPEPPELELVLPDGPRHPPPSVAPLSGLRFPAWVASGTGGSAATMLAQRTWGLPVVLGIAHQRLYERLREQRGIIYSVDGSYVPLDAEVAHITIGADCVDERGTEVATELLAILEELAADGPTEAELEERRRRAQRPDPDERGTRLARLADAADRALLGEEVPLDAEEAEARSAAVTREEARDALAGALETVLVVVPEGCERPREDLADLRRDPGPEPIEAPRAKPRLWQRGDGLQVGDAGLQWTDEEGERVTIPAAEIAFVLRNRDGDHHVTGVYGAYATINAARLKDPEPVMAALERLAEGRLVVDDDPTTPMVDTLAESQLKRRWMVSEELDLLPEVLRAGEQPRVMAEASRGMRAGLLVATDRRLLFIFKGMRKEEFLEVALADVREVDSTSRPWGTRLRVAANGERYVFKDLNPKERAGALAGALRSRSD